MITLHQGDCLQLASLYPDGHFQLLLTSTPYPGLRGCELTVPQYFDWWAARLAVLVPKLDPVSGVLVQVLKFGRVDGWFDTRLFDVPKVLEAAGLFMIDVYIWDKLNGSPATRAKCKRYDRNEWEFCFCAARSSSYAFYPVRRPYSAKTVKKAKSGNMRQTAVNGSQANGHSRLHPEGALQGNVLRMSSSGDGKRPRVRGGSYPRRLAQRFILQHTRPGQWILDPFVGAGTTLHVAQEYGRHGVGFDIDETAVSTAAAWLDYGQTNSHSLPENGNDSQASPSPSASSRCMSPAP